MSEKKENKKNNSNFVVENAGNKKAGGKKRNTPVINFLLGIALSLGILLLLSRFNLTVDLTNNNLHTLSKVSKETVSQLRDPLRISVFISKNLPPPMNDLRRSMEDLLYLYAQEAGDNFNYVFYDIDEKEEDNKAIEVARDYGISPKQVQTVERDEIKLINAYLAMVIEYGDLIEKIPVIDVNTSLELKVSSILERMKSRINSLIALEQPIEVTLVLPESFVGVARYFGVDGMSGIQENMSSLAEKALRKNYGKINYQEEIINIPSKYKQLVTVYPWDDFSTEGKRFAAGEGAAALVLENGNETAVVELLLGETALQLTGQGFQRVTEYRLIDEEEVEARFDAAIETVLQVNKRVAVLNENGASDLGIDSYAYSPAVGGQPGEAVNFGNLLKQRYQLSALSLAEVDERYNTLVIAGVNTKLSDFQLYKIDQFLMSGGSLVVFHDMFVETAAQGAGSPFGNIPQWQPNSSGLEKLLQHYGVQIKPAIVMDEKSFVGRQQQVDGTVTEQIAYFAPLIQNNYINTNFSLVENVRGFVMIAGSPVYANEEVLLKKGIVAEKLFSSTQRSWLQEEDVSLVPFLIQKPAEDDNFTNYNMGYVLEAEGEGAFESYFANKDIPVANEGEADATQAAIKAVETNGLSSTEKRRDVSAVGARLVVLPSSQIIKNNVIDAAGASPNAMLALNLIDYAARQEGWIEVRAKNQTVKPINPYNPEADFFEKLFTNPRIVKTVNMAFWPLLVALIALWNYMRLQRHRRAIKNL